MDLGKRTQSSHFLGGLAEAETAGRTSKAKEGRYQKRSLCLGSQLRASYVGCFIVFRSDSSSHQLHSETSIVTQPNRPPAVAQSKDIQLDNFDISYGGHVILKDASLSLSFGRRFGLVGRNGIGKTTLLRALSTRELYVSESISVLHVEQEVCCVFWEHRPDGN